MHPKREITAAAICCLILFIPPIGAMPQDAVSDPLGRALDSVALILYGAGAGRLSAAGVGAVVSPDGVILTSCAPLEQAREVQVRLRNGDVFDRVALLSIDRRRCVAALKIPGSGLPVLQAAPSDQLRVGRRIYSAHVSRAGVWSADEGAISALTTAEEGELAERFGHQAILFTSMGSRYPHEPSAPGLLLDEQGRLLGIGRGGTYPEQAVPIESVLGLKDQPAQTQLGNGSALQTEGSRSLGGKAVADADPETQLRKARTLYVTSSSVFMKPGQLHVALMKRPEFKELELKLVDGYQPGKLADVTIQLDRPLFTYYFTYEVTDNHTGIVLGAGKVTAFDGNAAAPELAKKILKLLAESRKPETGSDAEAAAEAPEPRAR